MPEEAAWLRHATPPPKVTTAKNDGKQRKNDGKQRKNDCKQRKNDRKQRKNDRKQTFYFGPLLAACSNRFGQLGLDDKKRGGSNSRTAPGYAPPPLPPQSKGRGALATDRPVRRLL